MILQKLFNHLYEVSQPKSKRMLMGYKLPQSFCVVYISILGICYCIALQRWWIPDINVNTITTSFVKLMAYMANKEYKTTTSVVVSFSEQVT